MTKMKTDLKCTAHPLSKYHPDKIITHISRVFRLTPNDAASADRVAGEISNRLGNVDPIVVLDPDGHGDAGAVPEPRVTDQKLP